MARADALFQLRLPEHLRNKLEEQANKKKQSLTSEILNRLEESFSNDSDKMLELVERIAALEKAVFYTKEHPVRKYRKLLGLTLENLAIEINTSASLLSAIEQGKKHPNQEMVIQLCKSLEVPIDTMLQELTDYINNK